MKVRLLIVGALGALTALSAAAQDAVTGKWNASMDTPQGPIAFVFDLKADGGALTGTMSNLTSTFEGGGPPGAPAESVVTATRTK